MNYHFFNLARKASSFSDCGPHKLGCVVVYKSKVISVAFNCSKTHPIQREYNTYRGINAAMPARLHAEINALNKIKDMDIDWKNVCVYIYREQKDGTPSNARPCNACMTMMKNLGIKHIYYSMQGSFCHEEIFESTIGKMAKKRTA